MGVMLLGTAAAGFLAGLVTGLATASRRRRCGHLKQWPGGWPEGAVGNRAPLVGHPVRTDLASRRPPGMPRTGPPQRAGESGRAR